MRLTVIGCSDAFGSGGRYHSCYLLETSEGRLMIDCGASAPLALTRAAVPAASIDAIVISHCHGDHFGGLPFLFLEKIFIERSNRPLEILGPPGIQRRFDDLLECMYPGIQNLPRNFEIVYKELAPGTSSQWRGLSISAFAVEHFSGTPSLALSFAGEKIRFSFSGDSCWCPGVADAGRDADLYLIECTLFSGPSPVHLDYQTIAANFDTIGAKRYLLTHMSPEMLMSLDKIDRNRCIAAKDGLSLTIGSDTLFAAVKRYKDRVGGKIF